MFHYVIIRYFVALWFQLIEFYVLVIARDSIHDHSIICF